MRDDTKFIIPFFQPLPAYCTNKRKETTTRRQGNEKIIDKNRSFCRLCLLKNPCFKKMDSSKRNPLAMRILPKDSDEEASPQESPSGRPSPRKRMCRNEVDSLELLLSCIVSTTFVHIPLSTDHTTLRLLVPTHKHRHRGARLDRCRSPPSA